MTKNIFVIRDYAEWFHLNRTIGDAVHELEMCKIIGICRDDPEMEDLRQKAELAVRAFHGKLNKAVYETEKDIRNEYFKRRSLF